MEKNQVINPQAYANCSEFYEVAKSVEFVKTYGGESRYFRIDALFHPQSNRYSTTAYIRESATLQPTYPQSNNGFDRKPENFQVWVVFDNIGWTDRPSAEEAIEQALRFMS